MVVLLAGLLLGAAAWARVLRSPGAEGSGGVSADAMTTAEHLRREVWWPTKPAATMKGYVGSEACARCHAGIAAEQRTSQMARTLGPASSSTVLRDHLGPAYHAGEYTYAIERSGQDLAMTVADGSERQRATLAWAFGSGDVGQSYLWTVAGEGAAKGGAAGDLKESRFNYFASLGGFAATPGRLAGTPVSLEMAVGRRLASFEARSCFSCHTTALAADVRLEGVVPSDAAAHGLAHGLVPGVSCEACHGPGAEHVAAAEANRGKADAWDRHIVNPATFSPIKAVELCGSCHSTPWDVRLMGAAGVQTVRFPAYRLEGSRCWGVAGDARLRCFSCHDPHAPLEKEPAAYDTACLQCHANRAGPGGMARETAQANGGAHPESVKGESARVGAACPVATAKCVSCHMPKIELPEMHYAFTDHRIRVARADAPFPD